MSLWLMNLVSSQDLFSDFPMADNHQLVAVITSSFQVIREESKTSAFTTEDQYVKRSLSVLPLD